MSTVGDRPLDDGSSFGLPEDKGKKKALPYLKKKPKPQKQERFFARV
jgi:hypothetical protein